MIDKQNGFTLVELAIALMVIGLLIGGVLKGQELIENARITRLVKDINDIKTAVMIFRSTYNALPGDFKFPHRIPNCTAAPCDNAGNGDGMITYVYNGHVFPLGPHNPDLLVNGEVGSFWQHLKFANMISLRFASEEYPLPLSPVQNVGYAIWRYTDASIGEPLTNPRHYLLLHYNVNGAAHQWNKILTPRQGFSIDLKLDDGKPFSGNTRVFYAYTSYGSPECADTNDVANNQYIVSNKQKKCQLAIALD